jgi:O-antigen/teichoic acid export membrane protein
MALPYITRFYDKGDMHGLRQTMRLSALVAVLVSAFPTVVFAIFGEWLLLKIFGEVYTAAYLPLVALSLGHFVTNFLGLSMPLLYATDYHKEAARIAVVGAAMNVGLCFILIPSLGALGAALAFGAGKVIRSALYLVAVRRRLGIGTTVFG